MLALATLSTALITLAMRTSAASEHATCPASPVATISSSERTCPALEVSGTVETSAATLDPSFDVAVPPSQLSRLGTGDAVLTGYAADGTPVFSFPIQANGAFHAYVPLAPSLAQSVVRLRLATAAASVEVATTSHREAAGEAVATDDSHLVFAWDAHSFPAVRIAAAPSGEPFAFGNGKATFEQLTLNSTARRLLVEFSDGVHSQIRVIPVFGR